jgi:hypothetical protein
MDSLVLDIGGSVGALIITTGPELAEEEIEISPGVDPTARRTHNVVRARRDRGVVLAYAAVFPTVPAGEYTVWNQDGSPYAVITVHGGQVTQLAMSRTTVDTRGPAARPHGGDTMVTYGSGLR